MKCALFNTVLEAAVYRKNHGGWLFVCGTECAWFDAQCYTPSKVMLHSLTKGFSGELICDNRFLTN